MLRETDYLKIVRASAAYDLIVTIGFATPWTFGILMGFVGMIHIQLGLPGAVPNLDLWHVLFANLMGTVVVVWSILRLHLNMAVLGRYDMAARWLFAAWQVYALSSGASWILIVFLALEVTFGVMQALPYRKERVPGP